MSCTGLAPASIPSRTRQSCGILAKGRLVGILERERGRAPHRGDETRQKPAYCSALEQLVDALTVTTGISSCSSSWVVIRAFVEPEVNGLGTHNQIERTASARLRGRGRNRAVVLMPTLLSFSNTGTTGPGTESSPAGGRATGSVVCRSVRMPRRFARRSIAMPSTETCRCASTWMSSSWPFTIFL